MFDVIFVDLDDVLADFVGGYCRLTGYDLEVLKARWPKGLWHLGDAISHAFDLNPVMTLDQFWRPLTGNEEFWVNLEPHPWCVNAMTLLGEYTEELHVLSATSHCDSSYTGKVRWLKKHFGPTFDRFMLTPHKHVLARPGALLVDDRPENCERFEWRRTPLGHRLARTGGVSVLFPQHNNVLGAWPDPLRHVESELKRLIATRSSSQ